MVHENFDTQNADYIKTLEKRYNIPVKAFSLPLKVSLPLLKGFQNTVKEFPNATLNLFPAQSFAFQYKKWLDKYAPKLCQKYDLKMHYRNLPLTFMLGVLPRNTENSLHTLRERGTVCLDLSAVWSSKQDIMRTISFLGDKLKCVYLSNVYKNVPYSRLESGILPVESFLTKLGQRNFHGPLVLKVSPKHLHEGDDEKMVKTLQESKAFIEKYFRGKGN